MSFQRISEKMEQDVSYLQWRARVHQLSQMQLVADFAELANNYRRLVSKDQLEQLEQLINHQRARLS